MFITNTRPAVDNTGTVSDESRAFGEQLSWELGVLMRIEPGRAIGPAFAFGFAETGGRTALKIRGRQFINDRISFELSAGYLSASVGTFVTHPHQPGFTADARINVEDLITVLATYDDVVWPDSMAGVFRYTDETSRGRALKVGVSAGSSAGVAATVVIAFLFGLFALGYAHGS